MSSILKALKKLEHEKSARKPDSFRIDAEILRGGASRNFFSTGASLAAIALFLCGGGATYVYMKHDKAPAPVKPPHVSKNEVKSEPSIATTLLPVSIIPSAEPKQHPSDNVISVPEKSKPSSRTIVKQQTQKVNPAELVPQTVTSEPKLVTPFGAVAPAAPPPKPVLKVIGIAFQDGADSVAVINGIAVSKGFMIEGARVEEIQKDRVKFSRGGENFEIVLDKSN